MKYIPITQEYMDRLRNGYDPLDAIGQHVHALLDGIDAAIDIIGKESIVSDPRAYAIEEIRRQNRC